MPLLVSARSARPDFADNIETSAGRSRRNSGSPPVRRMRSTPRLRKMSARALISSKWSRSSLGSHTYSASGMQYWQRKLHRSVTESRRFRSGRFRRSSTEVIVRGPEGGHYGRLAAVAGDASIMIRGVLSRVPTTRPGLFSFPRPVWLLGWVSLATDSASEAIYPLLPFFLTQVLGAGAVSLGIVEGAAEAVNSIVKIGSG